MDLSLFFRVLWRFKLLVFGGIVLAGLLAVFTYGSPTLAHGTPQIAPRGQESWQSQSQLLITYPGFPYGRTQQEPPATGRTPSAPVGFQTNLAALGVVYANLANSDVVQSELLHGAPAGSAVKGQAVYDPNSGLPQPFVSLTATAPTGPSATRLAERAAKDLQSYIANQQSVSGISPNQRVQLDLLQRGANAQLVLAPKITGAILVFLAVLTAAVSLAFILQNMRPRSAAASAREDEQAFALKGAASTVPEQQVEAIADPEERVWVVEGKQVAHAATPNGAAPAHAAIESDADPEGHDKAAAREPVEATGPSKPRKSPSKSRKSPAKPRKTSPKSRTQPVEAAKEPVEEPEPAQADELKSADRLVADDENGALPYGAENVAAIDQRLPGLVRRTGRRPGNGNPLT